MYRSTIGKLLYTLNSARQLRFRTIKVPYTVINFKILEILEYVGVIRGFHIQDNWGCLVSLKYTRQDACIFFNIKQVSKQTKRVYVNLTQLLKMKDRYGGGFFILSTKKGILVDYECIQHKIGGEVLLKINV